MEYLFQFHYIYIFQLNPPTFDSTFQSPHPYFLSKLMEWGDFSLNLRSDLLTFPIQFLFFPLFSNIQINSKNLVKITSKQLYLVSNSLYCE